MKKTRIYAVSLAALALAGCSDNEYIGDVNELHGGKAEINFSMKTPAMTRANELVGADAAALLNSNFVVEGIKGDGTTKTEVFDHYNVNYKAGTANTTESNTANWEYVGQTNHDLSAASSQTIKYWDYAANQYDFIAFSYGNGTGTTPTYSTLSEIKYANLGKAVDAEGNANSVYTITGSTEQLAASYIADLVTVYNHDGVSDYGKVVTPKFRSLGTKVRIAFYETVPGYSVKNVKFYNTAWNGTTATSTAGAAEATLFAANAIFPSATSKGTMSVYYPTVGRANSSHGTLSPDYNQAHIKFAAGSEAADALVTTKTFGALANMAAAEGTETTGNIYLGRTSATATYAGDVNATDHAYQTVLPLGTKDNLQIRIEYDLVPIDGAEEVIHVRDARAVVPAAYAEWKPNYAYTYIFKISDKTNGWVGVDGDGNVVEGLTPITFDAVVVDTEDGVQETITIVSTPSITTYQEGKVVTSGSEYQAGDVYASVMNGTTAVNLSSLTAPAGVAVYEATATDPKIITEALVQDQLNGTKHDTGITLTSCGYTIVSEVPAVDGNTLSVSACKFAVATGKTYVFMYTDGSKNYVKIIKVQ